MRWSCSTGPSSFLPRSYISAVRASAALTSASFAAAAVSLASASFSPCRMVRNLASLRSSTFGSSPSAFSAPALSPERKSSLMPARSLDAESSLASSASSSPSSSPASSPSSSPTPPSSTAAFPPAAEAPPSPSSLDSADSTSSVVLSIAAAAARLSAKAVSGVSANWGSYGWCGRCRGLVCKAGEDGGCPCRVGRDVGGRLRALLVHEVRALGEELVEVLENLRRRLARARLQLRERDLAHGAWQVEPLRRPLVEVLFQARVFVAVQPLVDLLLDPALLCDDLRALLLRGEGLEQRGIVGARDEAVLQHLVRLFGARLWRVLVFADGCDRDGVFARIEVQVGGLDFLRLVAPRPHARKLGALLEQLFQRLYDALGRVHRAHLDEPALLVRVALCKEPRA